VVTGNLTALKFWNRAQGEVRAMNGEVEFEIGQEPASYRAFAAVDHTWGLRLFSQAPLLVDPANPAHIKPAGLFQMWLTPAGMAGFVLLLLALASFSALFGTGQTAAAVQSHAQWMFSESPGPLTGITLHSPARQWKIVLLWSLLGVAMAVIPALSKGGNPLSRIGYMVLGIAFSLSLWLFAWHTRTLRISADDTGVRMTSVLGWRDLPWGSIRSVEDQDIFTTYFNGKLRMWELPFPGSSIRVLAFNDASDHTLMTFSPELEPKDSLRGLFELCTARTGLKLHGRTIAIPY
jgi:hypothetical protein